MKKITASDLNQLIYLETIDRVKDDFGGFKEACVNEKVIWSKMEMINNLSPQLKSHNFTHNFYKFTIRNTKIDSHNRIRLGLTPLKIESVKPSDKNGRFLEIIAYEKVKNELPQRM
jgi:head-tail adaptor